ncbi:MAG: cysteine hydrolase [Oscillospiraceae bacterium]|jgi:nicotinamidase/pyrazinamidase|nr:cysteine hydrolase [Oscillospiraceae bacterium]
MKSLLLVIDFQNDFVSGSLGFPGAEALDGPIAQRIAQYRSQGDHVAFTLDTHGPGYLDTQEGKRLPVPHCIRNTPGWELYGETGKSRLPGDFVLEKPAFPSLELGAWLREQAYDRVELVGLVSYICVLSNAIMVKAALPEAEISVNAACAAGPDPALHQKALDLLEALHITVTNR